jgi:hypothetical protein
MCWGFCGGIEGAGALYAAVGFYPSPVDPMTLIVTLGDIRGLIR